MVNGISSALSNTKSVKMVASGDSGIGAQKLTQEVMDISSSVPGMVKNMTGIDLLKVYVASWSYVYNSIQVYLSLYECS